MQGVTILKAAAVAASMMVAAGSAQAQSVEKFYKGRTITWVVGSGAGGSYGLYARILAPYLEKYIPGNPSIVIQHNPKGGGRHAANFVHNAAAKDGTVICMTQQNVPVFQVLQPAGIKFDVFKWNWIGNMATIRGVMALWHAAPATTLKGATRTEVIMGASGKSSETYMNPTLTNSLLGTKFKVVTGYRGSRPLFKAIEQGEVHGFAISGLSFKLRAQEWIKTRKIRFAAQTGLDADPDFPKVPVLWKLGKTKRDQEILKLVATASKFGRAIWAPPGVPPKRVEALRRAFDTAMKDPNFLVEAEKRRLPIEPVTAADLSAITRALAATDPDTITAAKQALDYN